MRNITLSAVEVQALRTLADGREIYEHENSRRERAIYGTDIRAIDHLFAIGMVDAKQRANGGVLVTDYRITARGREALVSVGPNTPLRQSGIARLALARMEGRESATHQLPSALQKARQFLIRFCVKYDFTVTMTRGENGRHIVRIADGAEYINAWNMDEIHAIAQAIVVARRHLLTQRVEV